MYIKVFFDSMNFCENPRDTALPINISITNKHIAICDSLPCTPSF